MTDTLLIGLGLGLAIAGLWDQFWTILGEGGGPITRRVAKGVWACAQALHRIHPESRLLSIGGASTILGTVGTWVIIQWVAWTLVFSGLPDGVVNASTGEPADLWERAYFAGYTLSTLGIGDVQPRGGAARVLAAAVSFNGLVQISFGVGYLVPIIVAATDKRRVAITVSCLGESSGDLLVNMWDGRSFQALQPFLEGLTPELALLEQRYLAYPVLPYLHGNKRAEAIGPSLAVLDETMTTLRYGLDRDALAETPLARGTLHAHRRALSTLMETLDTASGSSQGDVPPPPPLGPLRDARIPTVDDETFRERIEGLADRRRTLLHLVRADGWDWNAVMTSNTRRDDEQFASLYDTQDI